MKRALTILAVVAAIAVGVDMLGDLTQSRPDPVDDGAVSEVVVAVDVDRYGSGRDAAADALWAVCSAHVGSRVLGGGGVDPIGDGRYRAVLAPAVGEHDRRKLLGCLEDLTVERTLAKVESFRNVEAPPDQR